MSAVLAIDNIRIGASCKNSPPSTCKLTTCDGLRLEGEGKACKTEWKNGINDVCSRDTPGKVEDFCQIECGICYGKCSHMCIISK